MTKIQYTVDGQVIARPASKNTGKQKLLNNSMVDFVLSLQCCSYTKQQIYQERLEESDVMLEDRNIPTTAYRQRISVDASKSQEVDEVPSDNNEMSIPQPTSKSLSIDDMRMKSVLSSPSVSTSPRESWDVSAFKIASNDTDTTVCSNSEDDHSDCDVLDVDSSFSRAVADDDRFPPILPSTPTDVFEPAISSI